MQNTVIKIQVYKDAKWCDGNGSHSVMYRCPCGQNCIIKDIDEKHHLEDLRFLYDSPCSQNYKHITENTSEFVLSA